MVTRIGCFISLFGLAVACTSSVSGTAADGGKSGSPRSDGAASDDAGEAGAAAWTCPSGPFGDPIPPGATLTRIAAVPPSDSFNANRSADTTLEGPVWTGQTLYLSEFLGSPNPPPSRILQVTTSGDVSVVLADSGSNGLALNSSGVLYGAIHADGSISRFDLNAGSRTPIATGYQGNRFNSPNDLTIRRDGNIYFSDPSYQAPSPLPQTATRVYRIAPGTNAVTVVDATLTQPNGVTLSLDESTLYVSSTQGIHAYPVMADGSTGSGTVFVPGLNGDGMVIDCASNLYVAEIGTGNVDVLSPTGTQIGQLTAASVGAVTNVAFGGSDRKTLYVSAQGSGGQQGLFQVALGIPGMPY
jgi:gluconolactonase